MRGNKFVDKTIEIYSDLGWKSFFAKIRMWDAPYIEVEKLVPKKGNILDLGCGEGLFSNFLALSSPKRKIFGIDVDKTRVTQAQRGLKNTRFVHGDVSKKDLPKADIIIMFHLLHHLESFDDQIKVIKEVGRKIKKKSKLIIVEVEPKISLKFLSAWFTDYFLVPWLFEKKIYSPVFFRSSKEWANLLEESGFSCKIKEAEQNYPFSHVILECIKRH